MRRCHLFRRSGRGNHFRTDLPYGPRRSVRIQTPSGKGPACRAPLLKKTGRKRIYQRSPAELSHRNPAGDSSLLRGDTSISANHQLFGRLYKPHVAILGVGGVEVNGMSLTELWPEEAALVAKWLGVKVALPVHYRFDEGATFAKELKRQAPRVKSVLLRAGESYRFNLNEGRPRRSKVE